MKLTRRTILRSLFAMSIALCACGTPEPDNSEEPGPAVCEGSVTSPAAQVERGMSVVGPAVNTLHRDGDGIWAVESGSNTVTRYELSTGAATVRVDVGNERGPWAAWVGPDNLWVTNYLANTITVADLQTGELVAELEHVSLEGPAGITGTDDYVYVGNTQFRGDNEYGPGSVTVIDRDSQQVLGSVATARQNPQNLAIVDDRVAVVDSGAIEFDATGAHAGSEGAVELWTQTEDPLAPLIEVAVLPLVEDRRIGIPGKPAHHDGSGVIYLASGTAPVVFALEEKSMQWRRGSDDPIRLYETNEDALHHAAMGQDGVLYVTAFNSDEMYLLDTACDELLRDPIVLEDSSFLAGAADVVPVTTSGGTDVWFALSHANELGRVRLRNE